MPRSPFSPSGYRPGKFQRPVFFNADGSLAEPLRVGNGGALLAENGTPIGRGLLSGNGNPTSLNVAGTRGDVYRDTANGQLYVFGETVGPDGWMTVLRNESGGGSAGDDGAIFTTDGGYALWSNGINNSLGEVMGWSPTQGLTVNSQENGSSGPSANFDTRQVFYPNNSPAMDWLDGILYDENGYISAEYKIRTLTVMDASGAVSQVALSWSDSTGVDLTGQPYDNNNALAAFAPRIKHAINNSRAVVGAFKTFILTSGAAHTLSVTAGNDILIALDYTSATSPITLNLGPMIDGLVGGSGDGNIGAGNDGTEARIQIFSKLAVASLVLTFNRPAGTNAYQFVGAAIGGIAANGCHELRVSGLKIYRVR